MDSQDKLDIQAGASVDRGFDYEKRLDQHDEEIEALQEELLEHHGRLDGFFDHLYEGKEALKLWRAIGHLAERVATLEDKADD